LLSADTAVVCMCVDLVNLEDGYI